MQRFNAKIFSCCLKNIVVMHGANGLKNVVQPTTMSVHDCTLCCEVVLRWNGEHVYRQCTFLVYKCLLLKLPKYITSPLKFNTTVHRTRSQNWLTLDTP